MTKWSGEDAKGRGRQRRLCARALLGAALLALGPVSARAADPDPSRLHALLLNGGGSKRINYHSHLAHLRSLLALLDRAGVPRSRITVLASDGADAAPDLAVREEEAPALSWLLPREVARRLGPPIVYANSELDDVELRPATREALQAWFAQEGSRLRPGDTLLLYVTDHGKKNDADLADNTIVLWNDERLGVRELAALRGGLAPGVRVVLVMSQCFSGSFANAIYPEGADLPLGDTCGYFSVPADRQAYGCYPEAFREIAGHGHRLFQALEHTPDLAAAHRETLETDRTPDVPLTSSDHYLERLLWKASGEDRAAFEALVDRQLSEALDEPERWETELRLLDRMGASFGFSSPRSLEELRQQVTDFERLGKQLETYSQRWDATLEALRAENWERFLAEHEPWRARLVPTALQTLDWPARKALAETLLGELAAFTERQEVNGGRFDALRERAEEARALRYRTDVRLGVLLRMQGILVRIAGSHHVRQGSQPAARDALAALTVCEDLSLGPVPDGEMPAASARPEPFPTLADDEERMAAVAPAWLGINYRPVEDWEARALPRGAVEVLSVYEGSPAQRAGIEVADVITGPPSAPFVERHGIREWVMRSELGQPAQLRLRRDGEARSVTIGLSAFPLAMPEVAGRPKPGSRARELSTVPVAEGLSEGSPRGRLLFFFASWCGPCERAVPELLALSKARDLEIVAVSDEAAARLETFVRERSDPFPERVVSDPKRRDFRSFGVSGTPTIVLIDEAGIIQHYQVGYDPRRGIEVPGWEWTPPAPEGG